MIPAALPPSALRIALVGPTHPAKGGVAAHTTALAHELSAAGHDVLLVSWAQMFPKRLYPGELTVPGGTPDLPPYPRTVPVLHWSRPEGWVRTGWRLRDVDVLVIVHVIPQVVPAHLAIIRAAGPGRPGGPRIIAIVHNVLPHEARPGDSTLVRAFLGAVDGVVVHSDEQARAAIDLGAPRVAVAALPPHLPGGPPVARTPHDGPARLLALGIVRPYKGIDLLLKALAEVPGPTLTIAGEMWGKAGDEVRDLVADPRLAGRVELREGYVPADELADLLAAHDVLALTYRHATASQNVVLAHEHGLAVLASDVGTFGAQVRDGVDGLLVPPADESALTAALRALAQPGYAAQLRDAVSAPDVHGPWATYVGTIEALSADEPAVDDDLPVDASDASEEPVAPTQAAHRRVAASAGRMRDRATQKLIRRPPLRLSRSDLPPWVRPSDLLSTQDDATDAAELARDLGLPRARDPLAAWAALGALAAVIRVGHLDGDLVVVDCSGSGSPWPAWLRALGTTPTEYALGDPPPPLDAIDIDSGSVDVLTMLHPTDCDAGDVDGLLALAGWVLRRGGILSFTVAAGEASVPGAVAPADVRGISARADARGLALVGDLDGDVGNRLREASRRTVDPDAAYGLVRLTFRRR